MIIDRGFFSGKRRWDRKIKKQAIRGKLHRRTDRQISSLEVLEDRVMLTSISIGDRVWYDWNHDGLQSPDEAGPTGVSVELYNGQGQFVTSTSTGTNGFYSFSSEQLQPGSYSIRIIPPQGMGFTRPDIGNNDSLDSDAEPSTARTALFQISTGQTRTDIDVGLIAGTLPETPNVITPPPITNDSTPEIDWDVANGADRYELLLYSRDLGKLLYNEIDIEHPMFVVPNPLDAPGAYQAFVRSVDNHGFTSSWSSPRNFDVIDDGRLGRPSFLAPIGSTDDNTPELRWTAIEGRASYELLLYDKTRGQLVVRADRLTPPSYTHGSPLIDSQYQAFVKAISGNGPDSEWSFPHEFTVNTGEQSPEVPFLTGPRGRIEDNTPTIGWDSSNRADTYELLVYNVHLGKEVVHETNIATTSFTVENLLENARYSVYLRAWNDAGSSSWTTPMEFEVFVSGSVPGKPQLTSPNRFTDDDTPAIRWTEDDNADHFELLVYNINLGQPAIHEENVSVPEFTPTLRLVDAPYQAYVRGINSVGIGSWSNALFFDVETGSQTPQPPEFIAPTGTIDDNTPTMTWTSEADTDTYELLVYNRNLGTEAIHETLLQNPTFTQSAPLPDANYQAFVRGANQAGQSAWGTPLFFEIQTNPPPPPAPTITSPTGITDDNTPIVIWTDVASAETYELLVYNVDAGRQVAHETALESLSFEFTTILSDATHQAYVRGHNSGGTGLWSEPAYFEIDAEFDRPPAPVMTAPLGSTTEKTPSIMWQDIPSADDYEIFVYHVPSGQIAIHESNLVEPVFTPQMPLDPGTHAVYVRASNQSGTGPFNQVHNFDVHEIFNHPGDVGTTDDDGMVTLEINGENATMEFRNQITGRGFSGLSVASAVDPEHPWRAVITAIDPLEQAPMQIVVLEGKEQGVDQDDVLGVAIQPEPGTIATSIMQTLRTGILPPPPENPDERIEGFTGAIVSAFNKLRSSDQFLPPPLTGVLPRVEERQKMSIEDAHVRAQEELNKALAKDLLGLMIPTSGIPAPILPVLLASNIATTGTQHSPLLVFEAAGATEITYEKIRFGGVQITNLIPHFENGVDPDFMDQLAVLLGLPAINLGIKPTAEEGFLTEGFDYKLIHEDLPGLAWEGKTNSDGEATAETPPGRAKLKISKPNSTPLAPNLVLPPEDTDLGPKIQSQEVASIELVSSPDLTGFLNPGADVWFSAIAKDKDGQVIPNARLKLVIVNPVPDGSGNNVTEIILSDLSESNTGVARIGVRAGASMVYAVLVDENGNEIGIRSNLILASGTGNTGDPPAPVIVVGPLKVITREGDTQPATVDIQLLGPKPTDDVTVNVFSLDESEGILNTQKIVFTDQNWSQKKTFTITSVEDGIDDGQQEYTVRVTAAASFDTRWNGFNPPDVSVVNMDRPEIVVTPTSGLETTEDGGTASFSVQITGPPEEDVEILLVSTDTSEGNIVGPNLLFTPQNWRTAQNVIVQGADDDLPDGRVEYQILTGTRSNDAVYQSINPEDVTIFNVDNDAAFDGSWRGNYIHAGIGDGGCNYVSQGPMTMNISVSSSGVVTGSADTSNFELRFVPSCDFHSTTGAGGPINGQLNADGTITGRMTLNWWGGTALRDFTARVSGDVLNGTTISPTFGSEGTFILNRQQSLRLAVHDNATPYESVDQLTDWEAKQSLSEVIEYVEDTQLQTLDSAVLQDIEIHVTDLRGVQLGAVVGNVIYIDVDAAGFGWFVDSTPSISEEFEFSSSSSTFVAPVGSAAENRIDLRTVIMHEIGHVLGMDHSESDDNFMYSDLELGVRKLPKLETLDQIFEIESLELIFDLMD